MINRDTLIDEILYFTKHYEPWQKPVSEESLVAYCRAIVDKNMVVIVHDSWGRLLAYAECWRINYSELGWLVSGNSLDPIVHDLTSGNLCWINNLTIHPRYRSLGIMKELKRKVLNRHDDAVLFCGQRIEKSHKPFIFIKNNKLLVEVVKKHG